MKLSDVPAVPLPLHFAAVVGGVYILASAELGEAGRISGTIIVVVLAWLLGRAQMHKRVETTRCLLEQHYRAITLAWEITESQAADDYRERLQEAKDALEPPSE